ncbi:MAG: hypothetical protein ACKOCW_12505 [Planctomycetaceae bacterium]
MAIKFRCPGCKAKLYVPSRWQGNTIACPRCEAPAVVPAATASPPALDPSKPHAFDTKAVEVSLAALDAGRDDPFGDAPVTLPHPRARRRDRSSQRGPDGVTAPATGEPPIAEEVVVAVDTGPRPRRGLKSPVTLPWWGVYLYLGVLTLCGVAAFFFGFWWASTGAAGP